jgi:hypothetical protein
MGPLLGRMIGRTLIVPPDGWEVQEGACISIIAVAGCGRLRQQPERYGTPTGAEVDRSPEMENRRFEPLANNL